MLQLGWKAGTEQYSPDELLEYAVLAEQAVSIRLVPAIISIPGAKSARHALSGPGSGLRRLRQAKSTWAPG
jgi:hypothetical protein